ncbi:MAG: proline--tRNA ligase, partial [Clostridiaceae bacterium]|nr:proline--tRNA ligase [Clostridiaceae bacterium]
WKFSEYEMKGVPLRLELGPKDIEKNQCVVVRRDTREKIFASLDNLEDSIPKILATMQRELLINAARERDRKTYIACSMDEFAEICTKTPGFIKAMWCGDQSCENMVKEKTSATARCIPFEQENVSDSCVCCGKPAKHLVIWGKAY